jgi:dTDP-D-glucose 4,6-dehydratase
MLGVLFEDAVESSPERTGKDEAYWLKSEKIRQLGWTDQVMLECGLPGVIAWVKDNLSRFEKLPQEYIHLP